MYIWDNSLSSRFPTVSAQIIMGAGYRRSNKWWSMGWHSLSGSLFFSVTCSSLLVVGCFHYDSLFVFLPLLRCDDFHWWEGTTYERARKQSLSLFQPPSLPHCCQPVGRLPVVALIYFWFCLLFSDGSGGPVFAACFHLGKVRLLCLYRVEGKCPVWRPCVGWSGWLLCFCSF